MFTAIRQRAGPVLITGSLGAFGALGATLLGLPAPLLGGPALVLCAASVAGLRAEVPDAIRDPAFLVIGVTMGASVTPAVLETVQRWPGSFLAMTLALLAVIWLTRQLLHHRFGFDRRTALLAATPGHLTFVIALSEGAGPAMRPAVIAQSLRLLALTLLVPVAVGLSGSAATPKSAAEPPLALATLAAVLAAGWLTGSLLDRIRVPAARMFGGFLVSAPFFVTETLTGGVPGWLVNAAFLVVGCLIGARFAGVTRTELAQALGAGCAVTAIAVGVLALAAWGAAVVLDLPLATVLIAYAPGGLETMAAMAVALGADPAFVAGHHVFRLALLTALVPWFLARLSAGRP